MQNIPENPDYSQHMRPLIGNRLLKLPGACVAIENDKGELLLEKGFRHPYYRLIGGNADTRESVYDCAIREAKEETGLDITNLVPFGYYDHPSRIATLDNGNTFYSQTMLFWTRDYSGKIQKQFDEIDDLQWIKPDITDERIARSSRLFIGAFLKFRETGQFQFIHKAL